MFTSGIQLIYHRINLILLRLISDLSHFALDVAFLASQLSARGVQRILCTLAGQSYNIFESCMKLCPVLTLESLFPAPRALTLPSHHLVFSQRLKRTL